MEKTALLLDPVFLKHDPGQGHPESIGRYHAVTGILQEEGIKDKCHALPLRVATSQEILACHDGLYFEKARADIKAGRELLSTGDTHVCAGSFDVALAAAGSILNAVDGVFDGNFKNAFCAVRPPGHHASADRGMGFCIFNNVAVAARYAQRKHGAERVVIIDWDVHHGNGTQDIFYEDESVFYLSTHQWPWYPGTGAVVERGEGKGEGTTLNGPFPAGSGYKQINTLICEQFSSAMEKFRPDLVLISAGFDSRAGDPLGNFTLTDGQFVELTKRLMDLAHKYAGGRIVSVLEGGYNLEGLARGVKAHVGQLMDA
jgi:acetoin utilization deacetylase AcuC-like enzyme